MQGKSYMSKLHEIINKFSKKSLFYSPSPVTRMNSLEKIIGHGVKLYIKRDDQLKIFFGNKLRYIEYLLGEYYANNYNCIVHAGGTTSNYMTQLAMICAEYAIPAHIIISDEKPELLQGNLLIQSLMGAKHYFLKTNSDTNTDLKRYVSEYLIEKGNKPLLVDYPMANYFAYLGYMSCYSELIEQVKNNQLPHVDVICFSSGWRSYIGMSIANRLMENDIMILGYRNSLWSHGGLSKKYQNIQVFLNEKKNEFFDYCGINALDLEFFLTEDYVCGGYGETSKELFDVIFLLGKSEGIILDPVYTGKAMMGMLNDVETGKIAKNSTVLFIHSGGIFNNFLFSKEYSAYHTYHNPFLAV